MAMPRRGKKGGKRVKKDKKIKIKKKEYSSYISGNNHHHHKQKTALLLQSNSHTYHVLFKTLQGCPLCFLQWMDCSEEEKDRETGDPSDNGK